MSADTVTLPEDHQSPMDAVLNATITRRLIEFYDNLVSNGCIKPLPTEGPEFWVDAGAKSEVL